MTLSPELIYLAPLVPFGTFAFTVINGSRNSHLAKRSRLASAFSRFGTSSAYIDLKNIRAATPSKVVSDPQLMRNALAILAALEGIANTTSTSRADWKVVLTPTQFAEISGFMGSCKYLLQLVRGTSISLGGTYWTGRRKNAFHRLLKIFKH